MALVSARNGPGTKSLRSSPRFDASDVNVDVALFEQHSRDGTTAAWERAAKLYRGDFLDGIVVRDPAFDDWLDIERRQLRHAGEQALETLIGRYLEAGATERAEEVARRLLSLDPLRESACRVLMQIDAAHGRPTEAIRRYESFRDRLKRELGVEPEPATVELYDSIRRNRVRLAPEGNANAPPESGRLPLLAARENGGPARPSIAVLPFLNLSNDPAQEYFADGVVEDIITALARMRWLQVIARNSSFTYKGRAVDVKQIGLDLGVGYVLEGSLRKAENRIRIAGQLIDTATGTHLWADRFEGELDNVFDLQDRITTSVIGAIAPKLEQAEIERARRKPPANLDAYDYYLRGLACVHQWTREANAEALVHFSRAIDLDPSFAAAYGMAARSYSQRKSSGWTIDAAEEAREAERLARRAGELGKDDAVALATAGLALAFVVGDLDSGEDFTDRALDLNQNLAWGWLFSGLVKIWMGEPEVACQRISLALSLSPHDPHTFNMHGALAWAHYAAYRYRDALAFADMALREKPNLMFALCVKAASAALGGEIDRARMSMAGLRQLYPSLRLSTLRESFPTKRDDDFARWREGLQAAGLPD